MITKILYIMADKIENHGLIALMEQDISLSQSIRNLAYYIRVTARVIDSDLSQDVKDTLLGE